jgi:uncharacterized protein with ATP-grasp and redox domains
MLIKPDCIPCILKMALSAIRKLTDDEEVIKELTIRILQIPALQGRVWDLTSPSVIESVMNLLNETFNTSDPFRALKEEQNRKALEIYPKLKSLVEQSSDPLFMAVRLAVIGNFVDLMVSDHSTDVETTLEEELKKPIPENTFLAFRDKLKKARLLVYIGDNSGEIVFDRVLIETIRSLYDLRVYFVARGVPALNDATFREALSVGMDQAATIIENGMKAPVPGTLLSGCSSEFRDFFRKADLIIAKGGGNFDTLEEEKTLAQNITFMLLAKCFPYCRYFQTRMYQPILANFFH